MDAETGLGILASVSPQSTFRCAVKVRTILMSGYSWSFLTPFSMSLRSRMTFYSSTQHVPQSPTRKDSRLLFKVTRGSLFSEYRFVCNHIYHAHIPDNTRKNYPRHTWCRPGLVRDWKRVRHKPGMKFIQLETFLVDRRHLRFSTDRQPTTLLLGSLLQLRILCREGRLSYAIQRTTIRVLTSMRHVDLRA